MRDNAQAELSMLETVIDLPERFTLHNARYA